MKRIVLIIAWLACSVQAYREMRVTEHGRWTNVHRAFAIVSASGGPLTLFVMHASEWDGWSKEASW